MIHPFLCFLCHCHHVALGDVLRYAPFLDVSLVSLLTIDVSVSLSSSRRPILRGYIGSRGTGVHKQVTPCGCKPCMFGWEAIQVRLLGFELVVDSHDLNDIL